MSINKILNSIESLNFANTFNPYFEKCSVCDADDAPELRRYYLVQMLERAASTELDAIWVGRDLGYRGGRRTGLALTDDIHFSDHLCRWGLEPKRPTFDDLVAERTAAVIWTILLNIQTPVFLWNVFPLHPFVKGNPFTNRAHNTRERQAGTEILIELVNFLKPQRIIAVGNDAFKVLSTTFGDNQICKVRHPSYGGQKEFISGMRALYPSSSSILI